tara:strand:- start:7537 stop:8334 length:798 start_codon:yes stop_codon:yes gene_type:complete
MRVKKYLPSLLTLSSLFLGFLSILYIQRGEFILGCQLILIAALLDSLDGKLARKIGVSSLFGKEIDSLADVVSFCLAPSFLIFNMISSNFETYHPNFIITAILSSFPLLMGAIRLARFNVEHDEDNKKQYYDGLPTPMAAIAICALIMMNLEFKSHNLFLENNWTHYNIIIPSIILLSFLMIGKIQFSKFPLLSFSKGTKNSIRLILTLIGFVALGISSMIGLLHIALFLFATYYILSNIIFHFINNSIQLNQLKERIQMKKRES